MILKLVRRLGYLSCLKISELADQALMHFYPEHLTVYNVPRIIEFSDDLPKFFVGKILRRELYEKYLKWYRW